MTSPTCHRALWSIGAVALVLLGAAPALPAAKTEAARPPDIDWSAAAIDTDIKTHVMRLTGDVIITYGKMSVRADRAFATAGDFKDTRWTFDGNVRINADPRGNLRSNEAVVEFKDGQLKRATATGTPAEFDQKREDSNTTTRGHANQIVYEVGAGTVRLSDNAQVDDDKGSMTGPEITYNLREERVEASATSGTQGTQQRVHVTIPASEAPKIDTRPKPTAGDPNTPEAPAASTAPTSGTSTGTASSSTAPAPTQSAAAPASPPPSGSSAQAATQSAPH